MLCQLQSVYWNWVEPDSEFTLKARCVNEDSFSDVVEGKYTVLPPNIESVSPGNNSTASTNTFISVTFTEDVDPASVTDSSFYVMQDATPVSGTISVIGKTATFMPTIALTNGLVYTVTVTNAIRNISNYPMQAAFTWSFTALYTDPNILGLLRTDCITFYQSGDDCSHQKTLARSYTDNGDSTVTDNTTGLIWQKCSMGQNNDANCTGTETTTTWTEAINYCNNLNLADRTWKLPNRYELATLMKNDGSIDTTFPLLPDLPASTTYVSQYWSSTKCAQDIYVWAIEFITGYIDYASKTSSLFVRCVSQPALKN